MLVCFGITFMCILMRCLPLAMFSFEVTSTCSFICHDDIAVLGLSGFFTKSEICNVPMPCSCDVLGQIMIVLEWILIVPCSIYCCLSIHVLTCPFKWR